MTRPPKHPIVAILSSAAAAAVMGAGLWWVANNTFQVKGVGWLARRGDVLGSIWSGVAAGAVVGAIGGAVQLSVRRKRSTELAEQAALAGLDYETDARVVFGRHEGLRALPMFEDLRSADDLISGIRNGRAVASFDLTTVMPSRDREGSPTVTRRSVVVVPDAGFPAFDLRPRGLLVSLAQAAVGFRGLSFDAASAKDPADAEVIRRFERRYFVCPMHESAKWGTNAMVAAANDPDLREPIRRLLTLPVMRRLVESPGWEIQSHGGHLALARTRGGGLGTLTINGVRLPLQRPSLGPSATDRLALIDEALTIRDALEAGGPVVPAGTWVEADRQRARHLRRVVLALAGAILGFFGGFGAFATLMFNLDLAFPAMAAMMFVGFPLCVFGGLALGLGLGHGLSALLPTPEPAPAPGRSRSLPVAAIVGTMLGFFAGGIGGMGSLIALGIDPGDAWYLPLLFFGGAGLGAAIGLVTGAALGAHLGRRFGRGRPTRSATNPGEP